MKKGRLQFFTGFGIADWITQLVSIIVIIIFIPISIIAQPARIDIGSPRQITKDGAFNNNTHSWQQAIGGEGGTRKQLDMQTFQDSVDK